MGLLQLVVSPLDKKYSTKTPMLERLILFFFLFLLSTSICGQTSAGTLDSKADFDDFSGLPLVKKYGGVSALKLLYDLKDKQVYYINSKYFKYHHEFCGFRLEPNVQLEQFNRINYSNDPRRKYLLANINYYRSLGIYALEISPVDLMTEEDLVFLWNVVSKSTFIKTDLHILLNNTRLQSMSSSLSQTVPLLNPSDIYRNLSYQAISKYKSCGILHFIDDLKQQQDEINPMDIIVLNETPLVLPQVAGILVNEFQTPLSHLTILGQNRKIPVSAYKSAFKDSTLLQLNGQKVCYTVMSDTFKLEEAKKIKAPKSNKRKTALKFDLDVDSLISIENLNEKSYKYTGHKACNFGTLYQLSQIHEFKVPESAFVIPFHFYNEHVNTCQANQLIEDLRTRENQIIRNDSLKLLLGNIREAIKSAPVDSVLLKSITDKVMRNPEFTRMRFRSSTNAEDAKGFSGAGLYTSKTGILNDDKKTFEKAIKKVWASLWSFEAYSEREYYNIAHESVYMGILVHRSFPHEEVNGVAITKNLYRPESSGFVVNAQLGNENVVKPSQGITNDQFICYPNDTENMYKDKNTINIITQSSLNDDQLVMTEAEIQFLANQLEAIKKYFIRNTYTPKSYFDFGLDVEFKLDRGNRDLYIKQVRVYND
ncbi:hypothetical protein O3Q51_08670 [Cryomorphaceae bacterium 1068]|nr:hypothetical protein [Cryomorphaceae bacterium 1068]